MLVGSKSTTDSSKVACKVACGAGCHRPACPGDPVFQRRQRLVREAAAYWMPRRSLSSGAHSRDPLAEHDGGGTRARALAAPIAPELCKDNVPRRNKGAGKAGCPMHPQPRTQKQNKRTSVVHHRFTEKQSGLPCAMVLTAYNALSSATNSSCHRRPRIKADQPG